MIELKNGDLVQVIRGSSKGLIGHVHNIDADRIFVVRIQEDIDKGLLPVMGDYNASSLMRIYKDNKLRYAAFERCACGAGMAYPKGEPLTEINSWECSDILTGRALAKDLECKNIHTGQMPFAFYEVKSEDQPSANGATTRSNL